MEGGKELEPGWGGDFTARKEDGIYQILCGALKSRCFTIHAGVHDVPMRVVFNYFTLARGGGGATGRSCTGPCHLDDSNLATDVVRVIDPHDVLPAHRCAVLLADAGQQEASVFIGDRSLHAC